MLETIFKYSPKLESQPDVLPQTPFCESFGPSRLRGMAGWSPDSSIWRLHSSLITPNKWEGGHLQDDDNVVGTMQPTSF